MSKKRLALLIATVLILLCGCGKNANVTSVLQDETTASVEAENSVTPESQGAVEDNTANENVAKEYDHNLVCDRWADSGSFKLYTSADESFDFFFDYSVPQIVDDTEDAKEINYFIECLFEDMHNTMQKAAKEGTMTAEEFNSTDWFQTNYDCYWNGSIASIVIYSTGYYDNYTKYNVYNYDFETGTQVINEDLFALKGTTGEEFADNIRRAAVYTLDKDMQMFFESEMPLTEEKCWYTDVVDDDIQRMYADYLVARAKTIYWDNINEFLPIYLDAQGNLQAITHLFTMNLYGETIDILSPIKWVNHGVKATSGALLDVSSKDDGIYLTIYKDDWSETVRDEFPTFDFGKEYKINGLYKNYINAKVSWVGNGRQPYILLISDDGMVSYVDVWEGIVSGYFCAVEPLWGIDNITTFDDDPENRVVAVNSAGMSVDLEEALYLILTCRYVDFEKNMLNLGTAAKYSATVKHNESGQDVEYEEMIGFTDDEYHLFERETYKTDTYEGGAQLGYITFNGMNEEGMVFYFYLVGEEGELRGAMAVNVFSFWDGEYSDFIDGADLFWLSGFDIFESKGNRVALSVSVG